jgi:hypothetical protein
MASLYPSLPIRFVIQGVSRDAVAILDMGTVELVDVPGPFDALVIALGGEYLLGLAALNHFGVTFDHGHRLIVER